MACYLYFLEGISGGSPVLMQRRCLRGLQCAFCCMTCRVCCANATQCKLTDKQKNRSFMDPTDETRLCLLTASCETTVGTRQPCCVDWDALLCARQWQI